MICEGSALLVLSLYLVEGKEKFMYNELIKVALCLSGYGSELAVLKEEVSE